MCERRRSPFHKTATANRNSLRGKRRKHDARGTGIPAAARASSRTVTNHPRACGPLCRPEVGVPSRWRDRDLWPYALCGPVGRVPTGGRRSKPGARSGPVALRALRPCGPRADRRSAFQAGGAIGTHGPTRSAALWAACRPEVGVPSRGRDRDLWPHALCGPVGRVPTGGRRSRPLRHLRRWALHSVAPSGPVALRALRACGPRADRRSAFQAVAPPPPVGVARRGSIRTCSPTRSAGLRPAVPTGGRRSKPLRHLRRWALHAVAPSGPVALRACGPVGRVPTRCGPRADRRSAFQAAACCGSVAVWSAAFPTARSGWRWSGRPDQASPRSG